MKELSLLEMMKQMENEMPLSWKIKNIPYKIWAKFYVFFHLSLPNYKYKFIEIICKHEWKKVNKEEYSDNYILLCDKCGKLK